MSVRRASNQTLSDTLFDLCHLCSGLDLSMKLIDEHCEEKNPRVSCLPISASGAGCPRLRLPTSISRRALLCSLSSVRAPPVRVCTPRFALGAPMPTTSLPPTGYPIFGPNPSTTFRLLLKRPISSSVECGAFREKSGGIINQGSHRRRHVTLGRDPPVQTKQFDLKSFPLSSTPEKELQE